LQFNLKGDTAIRNGLEKGVPVAELEVIWQDELGHFMEARGEFLLYLD
jgi:uncharacterized protein YbbC (DUF1343 family)